jgi:protein TonB
MLHPYRCLKAAFQVAFTAACLAATPLSAQHAAKKPVRAAPAAAAPEVEEQGFVMVEQMPSMANLSEYLAAHIRYPESARKAGQEGRSIVRFMVMASGAIRRPELVRTSGVPALDSEALRVISGMPAWTPGKQNGKAVNVYFTLPVTFRLE